MGSATGSLESPARMDPSVMGSKLSLLPILKRFHARRVAKAAWRSRRWYWRHLGKGPNSPFLWCNCQDLRDCNGAVQTKYDTYQASRTAVNRTKSKRSLSLLLVGISFFTCYDTVVRFHGLQKWASPSSLLGSEVFCTVLTPPSFPPVYSRSIEPNRPTRNIKDAASIRAKVLATL